jgi:hypothetical protein
MDKHGVHPAVVLNHHLIHIDTSILVRPGWLLFCFLLALERFEPSVPVEDQIPGLHYHQDALLSNVVNCRMSRSVSMVLAKINSGNLAPAMRASGTLRRAAR